MLPPRNSRGYLQIPLPAPVVCGKPIGSPYTDACYRLSRRELEWFWGSKVVIRLQEA
jgi:hypothetical protein